MLHNVPIRCREKGMDFGQEALYFPDSIDRFATLFGRSCG
jgi:hypothetical protein